MEVQEIIISSVKALKKHFVLKYWADSVIRLTDAGFQKSLTNYVPDELRKEREES